MNINWHFKVMINFVCPRKPSQKKLWAKYQPETFGNTLQDDGLFKRKKTFFTSNDPADTHIQSLTCLLSKNTFGLVGL